MSLSLALRRVTTTSFNRVLGGTQILHQFKAFEHDEPIFHCFAVEKPDNKITQHLIARYQQEDQFKLPKQGPHADTKLRILFLTNAHNAMSQAAYLMLTQMGHTVMVELALSSKQMEHITNELKPDLVICPFLTKYVPHSLYSKFKTLIVHPGIVGDRGMHSLDWALLEKQQEWGVTIMEADKEMDAGAIYATANFSLNTLPISELTKSKVYRNQVVPTALKVMERAVRVFVQRIDPIPLDYSNPAVKGTLKPTMKQSECAIDWNKDDAHTVVRKISSRDTNPGLLDSQIVGKKMYLYGAHLEKLLKIPPNTSPKQLLGQRDGAILVSCNGGKEAVWITHMKYASQNGIKLPSTMLLTSDHLLELPVLVTNFTTVPVNRTFNEIYYEQKDDVVYLHFTFYNGAMSTKQCYRLLEALEEVSKIDTAKFIVLCGGSTYFSNGIHLNVIEATDNHYDESWANINAINDIVLKIMSITNKITISVLQGSAGAGGVMMALAADYVYANSKTILNPHYRTMGLFGSEYWTYNLPRRVGYQRAFELTEGCQPVSAAKAEEIGLADGVFDGTGGEMLKQIQHITQSTPNNKFSNFINKKEKERDASFHEQLATHRFNELAKMSDNFRTTAYRTARHSYVHKIVQSVTPWNLKRLGREKAIRIDGKEIANRLVTGLTEDINNIQAQAKDVGLVTRLPGLACLLIGSRHDSHLYVAKKATLAASLGFFNQVVEIQEDETQSTSELETKIIRQIEQWNDDHRIDGILVQLPLPINLNRRRILDTIDVEKDVDGLHSLQLADLTSYPASQPAGTSFITCTVRGILELLQLYDIKLPGKTVCVVGASKTVGLPLSLALSSRGATVTICTVHTCDLRNKVEKSDIIVACAGVAHVVKAQWVKLGAIVIDAGITLAYNNVTGKAKILGDVEQTDVLWKRASLVTPVPGGVGPITVAMLLRNTVDAYKFRLTREMERAKAFRNLQ